MTLPPKDYISARKRELLEQIEALKGQVADLEAMESVLKQRHAKGTEYRQAPLEDEPENALGVASAITPRQRFGKTIKQMVLEVLDAMPGLLSSEVLDAINAKYAIVLERTSLSPQLSRLKAEDQIVAFNNRWRLTEQGQQLLAELRT